MSRALSRRLARIEGTCSESGPVETMTDAELLRIFRREVDRAGGIDAVIAEMRAAGEHEAASEYARLYVCRRLVELDAADCH
jgi:hypothetical protein